MISIGGKDRSSTVPGVTSKEQEARAQVSPLLLGIVILLITHSTKGSSMTVEHHHHSGELASYHPVYITPKQAQ